MERQRGYWTHTSHDHHHHSHSFSLSERERKVFNRRQLSVLDYSIRLLYKFFHADGEGMGLPQKVLDTPHYKECMQLISNYHGDMSRLKREYELSLLTVRGREKELILRLIRLRVQISEEGGGGGGSSSSTVSSSSSSSGQSQQIDANINREECRAWFEQQLVKRRQRG